jgi:hypothetical protein
MAKPNTVGEYLDRLPDDRRKAIEAPRKTICKNIDETFEEGIPLEVLAALFKKSESEESHRELRGWSGEWPPMILLTSSRNAA